MSTRRTFLRGVGTVAFTGVAASWPRTGYAEPPPETTRLRLMRTASLCWAPQYVAEDLLRAEGFTEVEYVAFPGGAVSQVLSAGKADMSLNFVAPNLVRLDQGDPVVFLAGVHVGCFEIFGGSRVHRITDIKGKTAGVATMRGAEHIFFACVAAYVGLHPDRDITWTLNSPDQSIQLLTEGKIDAFLGFPPIPQRLRASGTGNVLVNSAVDRPWSQYFCCLLTAHREFVRKHPVATKRALRGILKAADFCVQDPERAARMLVNRKFTPEYAPALQVLKDLPYDRWREYDPEDTIRFYALRLHEAGMIRQSPRKVLAEATEWTFLNELKRELKA